MAAAGAITASAGTPAGRVAVTRTRAGGRAADALDAAFFCFDNVANCGGEQPQNQSGK